MTTDWTSTLLAQLTMHWELQLRPGLDGLTDEEYLWEPVDGCWSIRPRDEARTPMAAGGGDLVADFQMPEPVPPPVTTIAWRMGHVIVGIFGMRNASHFGGPPTDYVSKVWPPTAKDALADLDTEYEHWVSGVRAIDEAGLSRPIGEAEGEWAEHSWADLILHINREVLHHGAEMLLLRDLYRHR
jgi:hypothetical protein